MGRYVVKAGTPGHRGRLTALYTDADGIWTRFDDDDGWDFRRPIIFNARYTADEVVRTLTIIGLYAPRVVRLVPKKRNGRGNKQES